MSDLKLIKRKGIRDLALDVSKREKAGKFTRVGAEFYEVCEAHMRQFITQHIKHLPSVGKTIT
jgi:hypothetical protein